MASTDKAAKTIVNGSNSADPNGEPGSGSGLHGESFSSAAQEAGPATILPIMSNEEDTGNGRPDGTSTTDTTGTATSSQTSKPIAPSAEPMEGMEERPRIFEAHRKADNPSGAPFTDNEEFVDAYYALETLKESVPHVSWSLLFDVYVAKLNEEKKTGANEGLNGTQDRQGSTLIKSFVDYIHDLEERIANLESGIVMKKDEEESTKTEDKSKPTIEVPATIQLNDSVRFYDISDGLNFMGEFVTQKNQEDFQNPGFLKIFYVRKAGNTDQGRPGNDEWPDAGAIDIVAIFLQSRPISTFLSNDLPIDRVRDENQQHLRITKPFRPLILGADALRRQLAFLESRHGNVHMNRDAVQTEDGTKRSPGSPSPSPLTEAKTADPEAPLNKAGADASEASKEEAYNGTNALPHFVTLIKLMDKYFSRQERLMQDIANASVERIAFEDLWMIFQSESVIVSRSVGSGKYFRNGLGEYVADSYGSMVRRRRATFQAYRVLTTDGGRPLRSANLQTESGKKREEPTLRTQGATGPPPVNTRTEPTAEANSGRRMKSQYMPFFIYCYHIDTDGIEFGAVTEVITINPFDDLVDIRSLEAFPMRYLDASTPVPPPITPSKATPPDWKADTPDSSSHPRAMRVLTERGKRFMDLTAISHVNFDGVTVGETKEEINGALIVDIRLGLQEWNDDVIPRFGYMDGLYTHYYIGIPELSHCCHIPWCDGSPCGEDYYISHLEKLSADCILQLKTRLEEFEEQASRHPAGAEILSESMKEYGLIELLPGVVPAFVLRNRKWVIVPIDQLKYVDQEDNWKELVLPEGHRDIVQSMVDSRSGEPLKSQNHSRIGMDLVRGKGRGCIILLHGAPGVGKTSAAECVAAYTQRPLYPITCGDIGYEPAAVEEHMEKHFTLAHRWGCVLLLDEADVFLAKRNREDVKRNGLVSVFLRILEYYSGILFLTTNRVGAIDDAFRSRLHLTLFYPKLDKDQTLEIWGSNLKRLKVMNRDMKDRGEDHVRFDKREIMSWAKENWSELEWNGRQIRNAFQTAIALAKFHNKNGDSTAKLKVEHFVIVANASAQFNSYMAMIHGKDESKAAVVDKTRADPSYKPANKFKAPKEYDTDSSSSDDDSDRGKRRDERTSGKKTKQETEDAKSKRENGKKTEKSIKIDVGDSKKKADSSDDSGSSDSDQSDETHKKSSKSSRPKKG